MGHVLVDQARGWLGTRFHHQGRLKKAAGQQGGVDCLGLLIGVARELGLRARDGELLERFDVTHYGHFPDGVALRRELERHLAVVEVMGVGDVVLCDVDGQARHVAIVGDGREGMTLIHAYAPARRVVEQYLDDVWRGRIVAVFRVV